MSEHGFIAFSMKITASAQAPCQPPSLPSRQANLLSSPLFFGHPDHQLCLPSPELGTHRDTHWTHTVQPPYWRGSLTPPRTVGNEEGGTSGAFLAHLREQLVVMPHSVSWRQGDDRQALSLAGTLEIVPGGEMRKHWNRES